MRKILLLNVDTVVETPQQCALDYGTGYDTGDRQIILDALNLAAQSARNITVFPDKASDFFAIFGFHLITNKAFSDHRTKLYVEMTLRASLDLNGLQLSDDIQSVRNWLNDIEENAVTQQECQSRFRKLVSNKLRDSR